MKYEAVFINRFKSLIEEFQLNYKVISEEELALFGSSFALVFLIHFDEVSLDYVSVIKIICLLVLMSGLIFYMSLMIKIGRICQNIILCRRGLMSHF